MAKTISQLLDATVVNGSDELIIQQSGVTKRATKTEVLAGIVNANVDAAAAIAGTKISPDFGSQTILTTGLLGVGASPDTKIMAEGPTFVAIKAKSTGADSSAALMVENDARVWRVQVQGVSNDNLIFYDDTADETRMAINTSGNVGIGTNSPSTRLDVHGAAFCGARIKSNDGNSSAALILENDARDWRIQAQGSDSDKLYFYDNTATAARMAIDANGNVSIGGSSANAAALLDVGSTTKGFLPPRMTTAQRDAISTPPAGLMIYNTSTNKLNVRTASSWEAVTSS